MFYPPPSYDVFSDKTDQVNNEAIAIIPRAQIEEYFTDSINQLGFFLDYLKKGKPEEIAVVGTPAPKADVNRLWPVIEESSHFQKIADRLNLKVDDSKSITPGIVRVKLWSVLMGMLQGKCDDHGVRFIPVPDETRLPDGGLKPEYWGDDVTHANKEYGELVLKYFLQRIGHKSAY